MSLHFFKFATISTLTFLVMVSAKNLTQAAEETNTAQDYEFFEKQVRPLLAEHCYSCHSAKSDKLKAGLYVDRRSSLLKGGDSGPAIIPHDVDGSLFIEAIRYESYEMPPKGKLSEAQIAIFEKWIRLGAPWPTEESPEEETGREVFELQKRKAEHWVWQPIKQPEIPHVHDSNWPKDELDNFILHRLEEAGLSPAAEADRNGLVRRLYFDLIGLPPTPDQVQHFVTDQSPTAVEHLVDELLASPHFGERWGRHWLDLVRYAESRGHEFDEDARNAYQYRDYVIRALNADIPYDQFIKEHIAGDLIESPRLHPTEGFNESILGTGFWFLGEWVHSPVDISKDESDRFDNMIDVMSKTFLGVTVSCARCHDHKFDAISTADYYALTGFLQSSCYRQVRFESLEHNREVAFQLEELKTKYQQQLATLLDDPLLNEKTVQVSLKAAVKDLTSGNPILVDYSQIAKEDYLQDGYLFGLRPRKAGEYLLTENSDQPGLTLALHDAAASDPFWNGLESVSESPTQMRDRLTKIPRSGRTLCTPTFSVEDGIVSVRVSGSGHVVACVDSHRLVAGPLHNETIQAISPKKNWVQMNLKRYIGHRIHLEFTPAENAQLEVICVLQGNDPAIIKRINDEEVLQVAEIQNRIEVLNKRIEEPGALSDQVAEILQKWLIEKRELKESVQQKSHLAMAMMDGTGEDGPLLIRGSSSNPGPLIPRRFLTAVSGDEPMHPQQGSGRLELAEQINASTNPLTSRVIVNRIWHHLLGRGIVPTTDDFGVLGQRPTHPELLDYLAVQFRNDGQSIKQMIRKIVLSRTYQMSSFAQAEALEKDPKNLLWHYRPPKRLEGEVIRDSLLAISGRLDETMYGQSIPIHLTSFMDGRGRPGKSGPLDGDNRRSIYISVRRNFISPFMLAFDTPVPFSTMGSRTVSNVPAQALILMNDPLVVELTKSWAERVCSIYSPHDEQSIQQSLTSFYESAFARSPSIQELEIATQYLYQQSAERNLPVDHPELWADVAHALVNTKEFIFIR
nr:PSD1 and planctomycete cytochrome C domain-containing protein [Rubinisphaera italica]